MWNKRSCEIAPPYKFLFMCIRIGFLFLPTLVTTYTKFLSFESFKKHICCLTLPLLFNLYFLTVFEQWCL